MKNFIFIIVLFLFSCDSKSQNTITPDLSQKNISISENDIETGWKRILLKNTNKWGFVNDKNEVMIPFEYDFINPFENGLSYAEKEGKKFFITKKNLILVTNYEEVDIFSEGLAAVKHKGKWGFIDEQANLIGPIVFDKVDYFRPNGLCAVQKNNKSGFINKKGEEIIPIIYDEAYQEMKDKNVIVKKNGKWAVFDNSGNQLSDFKYDSFKRANIVDFTKDIFKRDESTLFENGAALAEINGKYEFINAKAQAAFPNNKFDSASVFDTFKNAIVKRNRKYGIIKLDGTFKVPLEYDFINYFDDNHAFSEYYNAKKGKIYSIFNRNLKKIGESFEPVYNDFSSDTPTLIFKDLKSKYGMTNSEGEILIPFEFDEIYKIDGTPFLMAKKGSYFGVISNEGKMKIPFKYKSLDTVFDKFDDENLQHKFLFIADGKLIDIKNKVLLGEYNSISPIFYNHSKLIVSKNEKVGIIDINNKILLPIEYNEISNWVEYGPSKRHFVVKNGKTGLVEYETFKTIVPTVYEKFVQRNGLIFASKNGKSGILDIDNKIICPFIYDEITPNIFFENSFNKEDEQIFARKGKEYFQIDETGKVLRGDLSEKYVKEKTTWNKTNIPPPPPPKRKK